MQTRTYGDLFKTASALIGTGGELSTGEQDQVSYFINRRFQQAFDESPVWPRYFVSSEERALSAFGLGGTIPSQYRVPYSKFGVYQESDFFSPIDIYSPSGSGNGGIFMYKPSATKKWSLAFGTYSKSFHQGSGINSIVVSTVDVLFYQSDSVDYASPLDVPRWVDSGSGSMDGILDIDVLQVVPYGETEQFESSMSAPNREQRVRIGEFNRIHRKEAFLNNSTLEYNFYADTLGANILNVQGGTEKVFVSYKKEFNPFTVTSDYYNSTVEVPGEFFNFIAHAVYADFLRVQNRQEQAVAEEQVAEGYLFQELEKIDLRSNNNSIGKKFSTYVNRQSR